MAEIAAVLVRSALSARPEVKSALHALRLRQRLACVLRPDTPVVRGQLRRCKDFITYGVISEEVKRLLVEKRGERDAAGKPKPFFRLHPPRRGFERRGVKKGFGEGGVLGERSSMDELIKRMI